MRRGETKIYECLHCGDPFKARTAARKRGWARFCSKSCKAKRQEKRTGQNARYHERQCVRQREREDAHSEMMIGGGSPWDKNDPLY